MNLRPLQVPEECVICFEPLNSNMSALSCRHVFHSNCIKRVACNRNQAKCPICRTVYKCGTSPSNDRRLSPSNDRRLLIDGNMHFPNLDLFDEYGNIIDDDDDIIMDFGRQKRKIRSKCRSKKRRSKKRRSK